MLRLPVLVLAAAVLAALSAYADTQTLFQSGPWILYGGTSNSGHALCGMRVSDSAGNRTVHIKYFAGDDHLTIQMFKSTWHVPNGMRLAVTMQMGRNPVWSARAYGEADHIEFTIPYSGLDSFAREFRFSEAMRITFPEGNEAPWITSLAGTNAILDQFIGCMRAIRNAHPGGPSQPYSRAPSQPFGGEPAQPGPTPPGPSQPGPSQPGPQAGTPPQPGGSAGPSTGEPRKNFGESGAASGGGPSFGGTPYRGNGEAPPAPQPPPAPPQPSGNSDSDNGRI